MTPDTSAIVDVFGKEAGFVAGINRLAQPHTTWSDHMDIGLDVFKAQNSVCYSGCWSVLVVGIEPRTLFCTTKPHCQPLLNIVFFFLIEFNFWLCVCISVYGYGWVQLPTLSRRGCQYQELQVVVSCLKRVMENPIQEKDVFYQRAISPTLCQWFVCDIVGLAHVYGPSLWGVPLSGSLSLWPFTWQNLDRKGLFGSWSQ